MSIVESSPGADGALQDEVAVLVVNDDPGALFALRAVLSDLEAAIVTAGSGEQALLRLLKQDFCLILMDVKMAGLDGFDTARLIRSRPRSRDIPIIFLTSHRATDLDRAKGYEIGASDYLFMPVAPEALKAKVQAYIDSAPARRLQRQADMDRQPRSQAFAQEFEHAIGLDNARRTEGRMRPQPESLVPCAETDRLIAEHAGDYVALLDSAGMWQYASPSCQNEFGDAVQPGTRYIDIVHADDRERVKAGLSGAAASARNLRLQYRVLGRAEHYFESDVNSIRGASGAVAQLVVVSRDITERKEMEAYVLHQSFHDDLTGLPNRLLLMDRMGQATAHREQLHPQVGILFIDLDRFKEVNDLLGHAAGDRVLQDVAERLIACVRDGDTVARVAGDKFVVMLVGLHQVEGAAVVAEKIIATVSAACQIEGSELHIFPSIGVAIFPDDGHDPDTLLRNADIAMSHAKQGGGGRYSFFTAQMQEAASRRLALGVALQRAIGAGEFIMHYQPKVNARTGAISSFEALIRWPQDEGDWIAPSVFIPIAEESGRIEPIGTFAIEQTASVLQGWRTQGIDNIPIAVNVSALQFRREDIANRLEAAARAAGIEPSLLEVELTETGVMTDALHTIDILNDIHAMGMTISIDDFGTGYSSLAYLKRFPIDKLKIDTSFVRDIATDPSDAAIVVAIITLAHVLNLTVIAEGVETEAQIAFLTAHGCDEFQGNYFSAAVSDEDALAMLRRGPFSLPQTSTGAPP
jgi:diguanylate cyclase (GGDEF)-like protein/PAS domain S-box-containing protein